VRVVAGLGNPGPEYRDTRHNAGWMAVGEIARRCVPQARDQDYGGNGALARCGQVLLFRPLGYMNRSGPPVARLLKLYDVAPHELLVILDDADLPLGQLRLRRDGSSGRHKGLESLIGALQTEQFPRLRMGIGPCPEGIALRDFVLSPFGEREGAAVEEMIDRAADAALLWSREGIDAAMTRYNRKLDNESSS